MLRRGEFEFEESEGGNNEGEEEEGRRRAVRVVEVRAFRAQVVLFGGVS